MVFRFAFLVSLFLFAGPMQAQQLGVDLLINGDAETGDTSGWQSTGIDSVTPVDANSSGFGDFVFTGGTGTATQTLTQDVDISELANDVDNDVLAVVFEIQLQARSGDTAIATLFFVDELGATISNFVLEDDVRVPFEFECFSTRRAIPSGTRSLRVLLETSRSGGGSSDGFFDDAMLRVVTAILDPSSLGDVNRDGVVNFFDISPFIAVLSGKFQIEADIDGNGVVDFFDIQPFIDILSA